MAYANPSTFVAGEVLTAAQQNVLANNDRFFHGPPSAKAHRDATQLIGTGWIAIEFDTEKWDSDTIWSSTAAEKFNINTAGKYHCEFSGLFKASSGGTFRGAAIQIDSTARNTALESALSFVNADDFANLQFGVGISDTFYLTTTQFVSFLVIQDSGGSLGTSTELGHQFRAAITWVSS